MNIKKKLAISIACLHLGFIAPASANYQCSGQVKGVALDTANGDLLVESIGSVTWPRLCSFRSTANGVQPDDCKRMFATLLVAQTSGKSITFWVTDSATTCPQLPQFTYVNGIYLLVLDQ